MNQPPSSRKLRIAFSTVLCALVLASCTSTSPPEYTPPSTATPSPSPGESPSPSQPTEEPTEVPTEPPRVDPLPVGPSAVAVVPVCGSKKLVTGKTRDCRLRELTENEEFRSLVYRQGKDGYRLLESDELSTIAPTLLTVGSFNVLGGSHTEGKGARPGWRNSSVRMVDSVNLIKRENLSLVGLQELQPKQSVRFRSLLPGWSQYPGLEIETYASQNSIAWDTEIWERVDARTIAIPYFYGKPFKMPYVLLEHVETGRQLWVGNFHNPADVRGNQSRWRARAVELEGQLAKELSKGRQPVIYTGDFNDRENFFCGITRIIDMVASNGARRDGDSCYLGTPVSIDWILGSRAVEFFDHQLLNETQTRRISDQPLIVSKAYLEAEQDPKKCNFKKLNGERYVFCPKP